MGFFGALFGISKLNADPDQQRIARLLIEAVETEDREKLVEVSNLIRQRPWSGSETRNRVAHAVSIAKVSSVPETYTRVKKIGELLHKNINW
jgi:hypothetical protein